MIRNQALRDAILKLWPSVKPILEQRDGWLWFRQKMQDNPDYMKCLQLMLEDSEIRKHHNVIIGYGIGGTSQTTDGHLEQFLSTLLDRKFDGSTDRFGKLYQEFEDFYYQDELEIEIIAPLVNFSVGIAPLDLGAGVFIKKTPDDFQSKSLDPSPSILFDPMLVVRFCLSTVVKGKKYIGAEGHGEKEEHLRSVLKPAYNAIQRSLECIRLFRTGQVGTRFILERVKAWYSRFFGVSYDMGSDLRGFWHGGFYHVPAEEAEELRAFCEKYRGALSKAPSDIQAAVRRFNFSYERADIDDVVIDLMIALESLFLGGGERGEYGYRLALRAAGLLSNVPKGRAQVFEFIRICYSNLRGPVAHGGSMKETLYFPLIGTLDQRYHASEQELGD